MQKNTRKCYQFSHGYHAASMSPLSGLGGGRRWHRWHKVAPTHETSHCNKEEEYSSYLPSFAWNGGRSEAAD